MQPAVSTAASSNGFRWTTSPRPRKPSRPTSVLSICGPAASAVGQALVPTLNASTTPTFVSIFSTPAVTEPPIPMLFRTGVMNDRQQGSAIADYVVDSLGAKKIALVSQSDEYGKRGSEAVVGRLAARKLAPVSNEVFNISDT